MPVPMIFISSTFLEFKDERLILQNILTRVLPVGCNVAEHLTCDTPNLNIELRKWIEDSDIVVLLLGIRYGSTVGKISWMEKEVKFAKESGKKILPYIKKQKPPSIIADLDVRKQKALKRFIKFIKNEISPNIPIFSNNLELVGLVIRDVMHIVQILERETYEDGFL